MTTKINIGPTEPFFAIVNKFTISLGASATIPVKIINEPPFPIPLAVIRLPSQTRINVQHNIVNEQTILKLKVSTSLTPEYDSNADIPIA